MNDNITSQLRMPKSHPVLAEITIDTMKWYRFQQLNVSVRRRTLTPIVPEDERIAREWLARF